MNTVRPKKFSDLIDLARKIEFEPCKLIEKHGQILNFRRTMEE